MPDPMIERTDGAILATREQRAREASRPPDEHWCVWCVGDLAHEPTCPLVREFVEGLATAVAMDAVTKALNKEPRG